MDPTTKHHSPFTSGNVSLPANPAAQNTPAPSSDLNHDASQKTPTFSPFDISLHEMQRRGIVDEKGMFNQAKAPSSLPPIPPYIQNKFFTLFSGTFPIQTKDGTHSFPLNIGLLIQTALNGLQSALSLAGGGVFAFIDKEYVKSAFDLIDLGLFDTFSKKCLEPFGTEPNDYDFRIQIYRHSKNANLYQIKANALKVFNDCFNSLPPEERTWRSTDSFVKNNCFKQLKVVITEENKFFIVSFLGESLEVDLMFVEKLDINYLFRHNSLNLSLGFSSYGPYIHPSGGVNDCYQSICDKLNKIIHANTIKESNFKVWFTFLQLQSSFFRSYDKGLEEKTLKNALLHLRKQKEPLQSCCDLLTHTLENNLDKSGDVSAPFCLFMNACRSLVSYGEVEFASKLYAKIQENFPKEGLPSLFKQGDSLEQHFALLQLFGILAHDGEAICYTLDDFEPALQFVLKGESKSFTLLVPLQLEKALKTLLDTCSDELLERYFAFFFPNKSVPICEKPLKLEIPQELLKQGLNHPTLRRLFHYLAIGFTDHLDTDLLDLDEPSPHQLVILENYLRRFVPAISLRTLYENEWDIIQYFKALFLSNDPAISNKAFEIWNSKPNFKEKTKELIKVIPNSRWRIKLFKLAPSDNYIPSFISFFRQAEGLHHLSDFIEWILTHPEFITDEIDNLASLYLEKFGLTELAYKVLEKAKGLKIAPAFQQAAKRLNTPKELKKALEVGRDRVFFTPKEEALFLYHMIPLILKSDQQQAAQLLRELKQEHLDKKQKQEVNKWVVQLKQTPSIKHTLLLAEIDSAIQRNDLSKAHTDLVSLISQNPDNKGEVTKRLLKLSSLSKSLLLHPQISDYLPPERLVEELLKLNLIGEAFSYFPVKLKALNREIVTQVLAKQLKKIETHTIFSYLLDQKEEELLKKWISVYPPQKLTKDEIEKLLNLQSEAFSSLLRKNTTTETLRVYKEAYKTYIPKTSQEERSAWITLILEDNVASIFPILEWLEKTPPTMRQLTLFSSELFNSKEKNRFIELLTKRPIKKADLDALLPLYIQFNQMTLANVSTFVREAAKTNSDETKFAVWKAFEKVSREADSETWKNGIKLLTQTKSEQIFAFIKGETSFPEETPLAKMIANGAAEQITDPPGEVERLEQISTFHDRHNLTEDTPILSLYARSGHPPLLVKVLNQFTKWKLKKQKEQLPLLESVTKNIPQKHNVLAFDQTLMSLLCSTEIENFTSENLIFLIEILTHYPKSYTLHLALKLLHHLLTKNIKINNFNPKCLQLAAKESDVTLHKSVAAILEHSFLPKILKESEIRSIKLDLMEKKLQFYTEQPGRCALFEPIEYFLKDSGKIEDPEIEKKLFLIALDALFVGPSTTDLTLNLSEYINRLLVKMTKSSVGLSRQAYAYLQLRDILPIKVEYQIYPFRSNDLFYHFFTSLIKKSLKSDFITQEKYQNYYDFLYNHLLNLIYSYPENIEELIGYSHQYFLLQHLSGYDLKTEIVQNKFILLNFLLTKSPPSPDKDLSKILEMAFSISNKITLIAVPIEQQKTACIKALTHLIHHPSAHGITRAFLIYMENKNLTEESEIFQAFWDEISKAVQEKPCEDIATFQFIQNYCFVLLDLVKDHKVLAKKLFREFCDKIEKGEASKESLSLLSNFTRSSLAQ